MKIWNGDYGIGIEQNQTTLSTLTASKTFLNIIPHVVVILQPGYEDGCIFEEYVRAVIYIEAGELIKVTNEPDNAYLLNDKSIHEMITDDSFTFIQFITPLNVSPVYIIPDEPSADTLNQYAKDFRRYSGVTTKTTINIVLNFIKSIGFSHEGPDHVTIVETA